MMMTNNRDKEALNAIHKLKKGSQPKHEELVALLECENKEIIELLRSAAEKKRDEIFGRNIFFRGLIEYTNYCRKDCYYCGIRKGNSGVRRYRLTKEQVIDCVRFGYSVGFKTFVLQGGEDLYFNDDRMIELINAMHEVAPDCAITLSIGERSRESYERLKKEAGADRFLLRHEAITKELYYQLHPQSQPYETRINALHDLKEIGFQAGAGFMVGAPEQTIDNLATELEFLRNFNPQMVGIGPFIAQKDTPFRDRKNGSAEMTLKLLAIIRLLLPNVLLPATTALETIRENGRMQGFDYGANVIMPNLTPKDVAKEYNLYDGKKGCSAYRLDDLRAELEKKALTLASVRGDYCV